jgi:hypothetical protein
MKFFSAIFTLLAALGVSVALPSASLAADEPSDWTVRLANAPTLWSGFRDSSVTTPLATWRARIMVPSADSDVFASLPVTAAGVWPATEVRTAQRWYEVASPTYEVYLGRDENNFPQARLLGSHGADVYAAASKTTCAPGATYCAVHQPFIDGSDGGMETFVSLNVGASPGVVQHSTRAINWPAEWIVTWFDAGTNVTYEATLLDRGDAQCSDCSLRLAPDTGLTEDNRSTAQMLAQVASTFVPVQLAES